MLLKNALIDIMKTKSIHLVSIKEICEEADVNRSTFYRHYNTQYDLYDDIIEDMIEEKEEASMSDLTEIINSDDAVQLTFDSFLDDFDTP